MEQMKRIIAACLVSVFAMAYWNYSTLSTEKGNFDREMWAMDQRLRKMEAELIRQRLLIPMETAVFDVNGERKFQVIRSNIGSVLMMLERVETTSTGIRVFLRVGNPLSAEYKGLTARVQLKLKANDKEKMKPVNPPAIEVSIKDSLPPSSWITVSFEVATDDAEELRTIFFTPTFSGIQLPRRRGKSLNEDHVIIDWQKFAPRAELHLLRFL